jgi:hypothetical protein
MRKAHEEWVWALNFRDGGALLAMRGGDYRCSAMPRPNTKMKTSDRPTAKMIHA